jgi:hypothetical protein
MHDINEVPRNIRTFKKLYGKDSHHFGPTTTKKKPEPKIIGAG